MKGQIREEPLITLVETVDGRGLDQLLATLDMVKEEQTKFHKYAFEVLSGGNQRTVTYSKSAGSNGKGRLYADGALSMQGFSKKVRALLAGTLYHDIDMQNCHPVLLLQICQLHGWSAPLLANYVHNREQVLAATGLPRDKAKVDILTIMYGGNPKQWFPFARQFHREVWKIARLVSRQYATFAKPSSSRDTNPMFSLLSILLQDIENDLLMDISRFFSQNGYQVGVYVFDGLMIYRKSDGPLNPELLRRCEQSLKWKITLTEK